MGIIRHARPPRYTAVDRQTINDDRISFRARGVLAWLLDKPDNWDIRSTALAGEGTEGRDAIRTALRELEEFGYVARSKLQVEGGRWVTLTTVYEDPADNPIAPPRPDFQASGFRSSASQALSSSQTEKKASASQEGPNYEGRERARADAETIRQHCGACSGTGVTPDGFACFHPVQSRLQEPASRVESGCASDRPRREAPVPPVPPPADGTRGEAPVPDDRRADRTAPSPVARDPGGRAGGPAGDPAAAV